MNTTPLQVQIALGRLFSMMGRPSQPGDVDMYHRIRAAVMEASEESEQYQHNYARDRSKGAQGD